MNMQIEGKCGPKSLTTLRILTERDSRDWKLIEVDPCDRDVWRSRARSAMRAAR